MGMDGIGSLCSYRLDPAEVPIALQGEAAAKSTNATLLLLPTAKIRSTSPATQAPQPTTTATHPHLPQDLTTTGKVRSKAVKMLKKKTCGRKTAKKRETKRLWKLRDSGLPESFRSAPSGEIP